MRGVWEAGEVVEVVIPANLAETVVAWEGDGGRAWLARLPGLVGEVADRWDLDLAPPFEPGGNISWVAAARRRVDGADAVLKLQHPHPESAPEAAGLAAWDGAGSVRLLDHDPERCALLLERCRPGRPISADPDPLRAAREGAAIGARLHAVPVPPGLPTLAAVQAAWADQLEAQLVDHPAADPGLARRALATMRRPLPGIPDVLLHGDLNPTNVLAARREPWLAIDPKPLTGEREFGIAPVVRSRELGHSRADVLGRFDRLTSELGLDRDRARGWTIGQTIAWAFDGEHQAGHAEVARWLLEAGS